MNVPIDEPVSQFALGSKHVVALTRCGKVYSWGSNFFGQVGVINEREHSDLVEQPRLVYPLEQHIDKNSDEDTTAVQVAASDDNSFLLTASGRIFSWGRRNILLGR